MTKPDELDQDKPRPKPSRSEEALPIIEEYANSPREIIKKLVNVSIETASIAGLFIFV